MKSGGNASRSIATTSNATFRIFVICLFAIASVILAQQSTQANEPGVACAPVFYGPEFEAARAEAVTYSGKHATGYLPDVEWVYLDYRVHSECQADARMWYLKRVAGGAGHGFVFSDGRTLANRVWAESFNGKTYNLKKKSVRKKVECRNTSLLDGQPSFANPPDEPNIQITHLYLVPNLAEEQLEDLRNDVITHAEGFLIPITMFKNEEQVEKFGTQRCYRAPKSTGSQKLIQVEVDYWAGSRGRIETWCNAFRCYDKTFNPTGPRTRSSRKTQKFIFKKNSVVVKNKKEEFF